jgi:hypothetical protein
VVQTQGGLRLTPTDLVDLDDQVISRGSTDAPTIESDDQIVTFLGDIDDWDIDTQLRAAARLAIRARGVSLVKTSLMDGFWILDCAREYSGGLLILDLGLDMAKSFLTG